MRECQANQQDNDAKHTTKVVKTLFQDNDVKVLEWWRPNPDRNLIENVWVEIKKRVAARRLSNLKDLVFSLLKIL